jgi:hypothetical protein
MKRHRVSTRGSALLITLVFMALITIIVVGFLSSMQINRPAAFVFMERSRAAFYAQDGIASATATLDQVVLSTNTYWVSEPGQLIFSNTATASLANIPLSSGTNTALIPSAMSGYPAPNLNVASTRDPTEHIISNTGNPLNLNWIYVTQDGTRSQFINPFTYQWVANPLYTPTTANPVVGRFAYWTDDESSKINANTAWGRADVGNTNSLASPTMVDLAALQDSTNQITPAMASGLHTYITTNNYAALNNPFFDSPEQARQVSASAAAVKHFKSEIASYNHDPGLGLSMLNQPRFVLTTRPDRAGWTYNGTAWVGVNGLPGDPGTTNAGTPYYLRVLTNEGTVSAPDSISGSAANIAVDPGFLTNLSASRLNNTMNTLMREFQATNWPVASAPSSFASKFYPVGPNPSQGQYPSSDVALARSAQVGLNIIEYVRCKESPQQVVCPMRIDQAASASTTNYTFYSTGTFPTGNIFYGSTRAPVINEIGLYCPAGTPVAGPPAKIDFNYVLLYTEIYNPVNYGIVNYSITNMYLCADASGDPSITSSKIGIAESTKAVLNPGDLALVRRSVTGAPNVTSNVLAPRPAQMFLRIFLNSANGYIGFAPYSDLPSTTYGTNNSAFIPIPIDPVSTTTNDPTLSNVLIQSTEIDDPRIGVHSGAWKWHSYTAGVKNNTFGAMNSVYLTNTDIAPSGIAQQDTDANGNLSDASFYMPPPAGTTTPISYYTTGSPVNPLGYVTSVGELGYVHTGIESDTMSYSIPIHTSSALTSMPAGTPWRTLRLQPNNYANTQTVPDWALLDLFAVPTCSTNTQAAAILAPYGNTIGGRVNINASLQPTNFDSGRTMPLQAVFLGVTNSWAAGTTNSYATAGTISTNIINQVLSPTSVNGTGKYYPGTAAAAYATPGQIAEIQGVSDSGEASEENFREAIGQLCVRGDVFTVYSVGQAIKISPTGGLVVTGEQRAQAMVERYQDPVSSAVSLRPVYYRNLMP